MKTRVLYVERRTGSSPSIERVFRQIAADLPQGEFETAFQQVPFGNGAFNILKNLIFFRHHTADIYHITGDVHYIAFRLPKHKTLLTVHDLILLHIRSGLRRWILKKLFFTWPVRRAVQVNAISESTRGEIEFELNTDKDINVIADPLMAGFEPEPRRPFNSACPVILHIGTAPNKNLRGLIQAIKGLRCKLRILGELDDQTRSDLAAAGIEYDTAAGLDQASMTSEYRHCDIVSFCTTYEGFGLPIIEAQAMQKPLITSDMEPHRSVAGEGAIFVDPYDPTAIRRGIETLMGDTALRDRRVAAGKVNIKRFDSAQIAAQYADLYRRVIAGNQ